MLEALFKIIDLKDTEGIETTITNMQLFNDKCVILHFKKNDYHVRRVFFLSELKEAGTRETLALIEEMIEKVKTEA
ncbi:MAG: hypothetical protein IK122_00795 [Alphaproteobacteria bacterium]|nr:hypothetical protein [Alphaproteobacteria bacterium]MBR6502587.1 hypothetical protein [Clostridia bacterium]